MPPITKSSMQAVAQKALEEQAEDCKSKYVPVTIDFAAIEKEVSERKAKLVNSLEDVGTRKYQQDACDFFSIKPFIERVNSAVVGNLLYDAVKKCGDDFLANEGWGSLKNWGSTLVTAVIDSKNNHIYVANIGDSRAILVTKQKNGTYKCQRLTPCHQPTRKDEKDRLEKLDKNCLKQEDGYIKVKNGKIAVSRSIGDYTKRGNLITHEPEISITAFDPEVENYLIVGSDGVFANSYLCEYDVSALFLQMRKHFPRGNLSVYIPSVLIAAVKAKDALREVSSQDNMFVQAVNLGQLRGRPEYDIALILADAHGSPDKVAGNVLFDPLRKELTTNFNQLYALTHMTDDLRVIRASFPPTAQNLKQVFDVLHKLLYNLIEEKVKKELSQYPNVEDFMQQITSRSPIGVIKRDLINCLTVILDPNKQKEDKALAINKFSSAIPFFVNVLPELIPRLTQFIMAAMAFISTDPLMNVCVTGELAAASLRFSALREKVASPLHTPTLMERTSEDGYIVQPTLCA